MKAWIVHRCSGRMRLKLGQKRMTLEEADMMELWFQKKPWVQQVKVHERTRCLILHYCGHEAQVIQAVQDFSWEKARESVVLPAHSSREISREFHEKLVGSLAMKFFGSLFLPRPIRILRTIWTMIPFLRRGLSALLRGKLTVEVLDACSIGLSVLQRDFGTGDSIMFLLNLGELLEEWSRKKSVEDLAQCMSLHVDRVWLKGSQGEVLTPISHIQEGDHIVVRVGGMIPVDGLLVEGDVMVNQSSLTGESIPVAKHPGGQVYAGTVVEEGECILQVQQTAGRSRYDQIIAMIEQSEQMKSTAENRASRLADRLIPYTFAGSFLTFLLTGSWMRALSILMVDFSCALKLAIPLAVLSAMGEAGREHITVKGGTFLERVAKADTVVFDKTGTLTHACPQVTEVISFNGQEEKELLRLAACLEEHFPHSMATAVVEEAKRQGLAHEEFHSKVEYLVAHGIASTVNQTRVLIGSAHFIFEDEGCVVPPGMEETFAQLPEHCSHLYLAMGGELAAVICIEDPLREEARQVLDELRRNGIQQVVMLTGDSQRTAASIAAQVGVDRFRSEVLPGDKAEYVAKLRAKGHTVLMVGDGINDSPALSEADAGIAMGDGAALAQEIADITMMSDSLWGMVRLRQLALALEKRIRRTYQGVLGFNGGLLLLGTLGLFSPAALAMLHNLSTLVISLNSMTPLPSED